MFLNGALAEVREDGIGDSIKTGSQAASLNLPDEKKGGFPDGSIA